MNIETLEALRAFQSENNVTTKGPLSLVVQLTEIIAKKPAPWNPDDFLTKNKGQVAGLGGGNLRRILAKHQITRVLASEGGRTSRGNMGLMGKYVVFMNELGRHGDIDFQGIEAFWAEQVDEFFRNQPFTLPADASRTIEGNLDELFEQARKRQTENPGTQYLGSILQHLTAAKLSLILGDGLDIHGASVADSPTDRGGDFVIGDTIIHCTTAPGDPLIHKCRTNLAAGAKPIIITLAERINVAVGLIDQAGLAGRVSVWDVQRFLAANINEWSHFEAAGHNAKIADLIGKYNAIIDAHETDPSLRIEFEGR
jgi:hypothetical protein